MSEGGEAGAVRHARLPYHQHAALVLFAIAVVGPICGLIFGNAPAASDNLIKGAYSLPMAIFGAIALTMPLRSPKDFFGGVMLVALALFAFWASSDLPGMRGFAFGPGTAPRMFAYCLFALGVIVATIGLLTDGDEMEPHSFSGPFGGALLLIILIPMTIYATRIGKSMPGGIAPDVVLALLEVLVLIGLALVISRFAARGPVFITAATLIFAVTVRPLGLVIASFVSIMVSAAGTHEVRWIEAIIWAAVLTLFCSLLFPYGLNLPLQLWPRF